MCIRVRLYIVAFNCYAVAFHWYCDRYCQLRNWRRILSTEALYESLDWEDVRVMAVLMRPVLCAVATIGNVVGVLPQLCYELSFGSVFYIHLMVAAIDTW